LGEGITGKSQRRGEIGVRIELTTMILGIVVIHKTKINTSRALRRKKTIIRVSSLVRL
jgi:hypothetical protein